MATRLENLRCAAFHARLLEKIIVEVEQHYKKGLAPIAVGNLRRRFNDLNYCLDDAVSHMKKSLKK